MSTLVYTEWRDAGLHVRYPFTDSSTLVNAEGVALDRDLFQDARLHPVGVDLPLHLGSIRIEPDFVTFVVAANGVEVASGSFPIAAVPDLVRLVDSAGRPAGVLVGDADLWEALSTKYGAGELVFPRNAAVFLESVVTPIPRDRVTGILLPDGTILSGDVWLVGTQGVVLRYDGSDIVVDVVGDPYALLNNCRERGVPIPNFCGVKTLGDVPPDDQGDWKLTAGALEAQDLNLRIDGAPGSTRIHRVGLPGIPDA